MQQGKPRIIHQMEKNLATLYLTKVGFVSKETLVRRCPPVVFLTGGVGLFNQVGWVVVIQQKLKVKSNERFAFDVAMIVVNIQLPLKLETVDRITFTICLRQSATIATAAPTDDAAITISYKIYMWTVKLDFLLVDWCLRIVLSNVKAKGILFCLS